MENMVGGVAAATVGRMETIARDLRQQTQALIQAVETGLR